MKLWILVAVCLVSSAALAQPKKLAPQVRLAVARDVAPGPKIRLSLNTRNVESLRLSAVRIEPDAWLRLREREKPPLARAIAPPLALGTISMLPPKPERDPNRIDHYWSRQVNLPPLVPGVYRLTVEGGGQSASGIVNITNLAVLVKRAPRTALVWVTDHKSGRVVSGARVQVVNKQGKALASASTGADGVARLAVVPGVDQTVLVHTATDVAGVTAGAEDPDGHLVAHLSTDRPIYRPGQSLAWKAILRRIKGGSYGVVANQAVTVEVRDSRESVLERKTLTTTAFGTVSDQLELPAEMALGPASIVVKVGEQSAYTTVSIAAYRKPEFLVTAKSEKKRYFTGEKAAFTLEARYYFGAPVPGATLHYQIRRSDSPWSAGDEEALRWYSGGDGNLYPSDTYNTTPFVAEGEAQTDAQGRARVAFTSTKDTPDSSYTLSATLTDGQKRQVETSASVAVYAASVRLGLSLSESCVAQGTVFPVQVRAVDLDGKAVSALVSVTAERSVWDEKQQRAHWERVAEAQVRAPGTTRLPAQGAGELRLTARAKDPMGRLALTRTELWVAGPGYKSVRTVEPEVTVRLDHRLYKPGETTKAFITTNTPTRPVLLTVEGGDVFSWTVLPAGKTSHRWAISATAALSPNVAVEVAQWAAPARLVSGSALLAIPDPGHKLNLTITPGKQEYEPGEMATARVRLTDQSGRPVRGEVAVGVVDAAIYSLRPDTTPNLFTHFWGQRSNQTQTFQSAPEEVSGGAYQRANGQNAPLRQRFVDTAFWDAHLVTTAADGTAQLTFPVPGNLTTWRWTGRAVTEATQVGEVTTETLATRPLTLRLATPRVLTAGDRFILVGTINNRTEAAQAVQLGLKMTGATVSALSLPTEVPAKGEALARWQVQVLPKEAPRELTLEASASVKEQVLDQLRVSVPVVPQGARQRFVQSLTLGGTQSLSLPLPAGFERGEVRVQVHTSVHAAARALAAEVLQRAPHSPAEATELLQVAAAFPESPIAAQRSALLLLARTQNPDGGWGSWEGARTNAAVTAQVLRALVATKADYPARLRVGAQESCLQLYSQTELWETRVALATALRDAKDPKAKALMEEIHRRGTKFLSPWARLRAAFEDVTLPLLEGDHVPAGEGFGWRATAVETTAEALPTLPEEAAARAARWLAAPGVWRTTGEDAAAAVALLRYTAALPPPQSASQTVRVALNEGEALLIGQEGMLRLPLQAGKNPPRLTLSGGTPATLVTVEATWWNDPKSAAPLLELPSLMGVRLWRRMEVRDDDGLWRELGSWGNALRVGVPLRVTLVVWPGARTEQVAIEEALPAGMEFVESVADGATRTEAHDSQILHWVEPQGEGPVTLTYYLRPELEGRWFTFAPALAWNVRNPQERTKTQDHYALEVSAAVEKAVLVLAPPMDWSGPR